MNSIQLAEDPYCKQCCTSNKQQKQEEKSKVKHNKNHRIKKQEKKPKQHRIPRGKREIDSDLSETESEEATELLSISSSEQENSPFQEDDEWEETIEHYLLYCTAYRKQRRTLFQKIAKETKNKFVDSQDISLKLLLTGYPCTEWKTRKRIIKHTVSFVRDTKNMKI